MSTPSSIAKQRLQALSHQLVESIPKACLFDGIPQIRQLASNSAGPRLRDKVIIITGANSPLGIGRATAYQFAQHSPRAIYLCDVDDSHLATYKQEIEALYGAVKAKGIRTDTDTADGSHGGNSDGVEVHTRQFDAADETAIKATVDDAIERYGRLDVMFANAGIVSASSVNSKASEKGKANATDGQEPRQNQRQKQPKVFTETTKEEFMEVMRVNVLGAFLAIKHAAPAMQITSSSSSPTQSQSALSPNSEKPYPSGSIIFTASTAGLRSNAGPTDYSASKAAVISLAQTTCFQLSGTGIRVNAICPGIVETAMTSSIFEAARAHGTEHKIGQLNPLRRPAVADEIARVALFLASDESSYVNGQAWAVCGGLSAGHPFIPGKMS